MINLKKIIIPFVFIIILTGCIESHQYIIINDSLYQSAPRDELIINNIQLLENILIINISYGGGCEDHIFRLISTSFMESYPVQVNVLLSHEDNNDPCDMWITESKHYNISPLKLSYKKYYNNDSGKIIMNIERWNESILYEF